MSTDQHAVDERAARLERAVANHHLHQDRQFRHGTYEIRHLASLSVKLSVARAAWIKVNAELRAAEEELRRHEETVRAYDHVGDVVEAVCKAHRKHGVIHIDGAMWSELSASTEAGADEQPSTTTGSVAET